jgi:hypothetical protein
VTTALRPFNDISSAIDFPLTSGMAVVHPPYEIHEKQQGAPSQRTINKRQRKESTFLQVLSMSGLSKCIFLFLMIAQAGKVC